MKKLWQKNWELDKEVEAFETEEDLLMDQKLIKYDIYGTLAHGKMLRQISILTDNEYKALLSGVKQILSLYEKGEFILELGDEDVHTKIENYLTDVFGGIGRKIHTGRSRNDQSLTMVRLYLKDQLVAIVSEALVLSSSFFSFAKKYQMVPMPGYTHMQKAMPMSVGMWAESFAEGLLDDASLLLRAISILDQSPLGSGAGFGVPIDTKREMTAGFLGFSRVQENPLYCQNSRGKFEAISLASFVNVLQTVNKFASDVLLFTTSEYGFLTVSNEICTGSSIMPQKKNLDIAELLRSKVHRVLGNYTALVGVSTNLVSGYNRDIQDTKKPIIESSELTLQTVKMAKVLLENMIPNIPVLQKVMTPGLFVTDNAFALVKKGMPFREAYGEAAKEYEKGNMQRKDITNHWEMNTEAYEKKKKILRKELNKKKRVFENAIAKLCEGR